MNRTVVPALIWAALMIGGALAVAYAQQMGWVSGAEERGAGVVIGLILAWAGNMMPKWGSGKACAGEPFRTRRTVGMMLMAGGILHAAIWALAPLEAAAWLSMVPVAVAMLLAVGVVMRMRRLP